jgi:SET and MYND domain-containing protein
MLAEVDIPGRGRGLIAARDIRAGETVLVDNPILVYVTEEAKRLVCANCLRILSNDGGTC